VGVFRNGKGSNVINRPLVVLVCVVGWTASAHGSPMRVIWDGPPCIATEIQTPTGDDLDNSKLILRVIKPLRWSNLPFSSIVSVHFSTDPFGSNYDRAQDVVTVESGKTHSGEAQIGMLSGPIHSMLQVQLKCVGTFENFTAIATLPRTPRVAARVYHLTGLERVDDAALATAVAQQQPNRETRVAAVVQAKEVADAAAVRANQAANAAAIANAMLVSQMGRQPVGSTLFCSSDPDWPRAPGDAVDRQSLVCHLVGKPNVPPMMGAALLTSGWTIVSESRRTAHKIILTADMGTVEITEVTLRKAI
jgi:hypothetical protein